MPVRSLWGCREEIIEAATHGPHPGDGLWFPKPLRYGEQAYFASEAVYDQRDDHVDERFWVDVEIDHHGIARGRLLYGHKLPIRGLTIRIKFDDEFLPEAVWWYAELTVNERWVQPPAGDRHRLPAARKRSPTHVHRACLSAAGALWLAFCWPMMKK